MWAVDKFRPYVEFTSFEVHCDHASLSWMFRTEQSSCRVRRWVLRLQGFNCKIKHRRGRANIPADALSRFPGVTQETTRPSLAEDWFPIETEEPAETVCFEVATLTDPIDTSPLSDHEKLVAEQRKDTLLQQLFECLESGTLPADPKEHKRIQDLANDSEIAPNGTLLYTAGERKVTWLPLHLRELVLNLEHDSPP